jgi:hypothetical protein
VSSVSAASQSHLPLRAGLDSPEKQREWIVFKTPHMPRESFPDGLHSPLLHQLAHSPVTTSTGDPGHGIDTAAIVSRLLLLPSYALPRDPLAKAKLWLDRVSTRDCHPWSLIHPSPSSNKTLSHNKPCRANTEAHHNDHPPAI